MQTPSALAGRKILITGATGVLGRALSVTLAQMGAELILLARRKSRLEELDDVIAEAGGTPPTLVELDFLRADDILYQELAGALAQEHAADGLHGLVLASGLHTGLHPLEHLSIKDWRKIFDVNLNGPFLLVHQLLPLLKQAQGHLIGITAPQDNMSHAFWGAYGASKAALDALLAGCAEENEKTLQVTRFAPAPMPSPIRGAVYPGETLDSLPPVQNNVDQIVALLERPLSPAGRI
ncbi:short-chain dehydrogenase [Oceanococcus atlanticus]|uniref:Short-chain dehydrogenase n=1 Tax=Oceanococcus atlanticus TaxID=1317117 RepID=A0A1Y1SF52_9GAMM|nr:SDR family NAD(P)-dependent oxidoreductase [Oceanococcus atlanticus]ORE88287.1 short-chain dehydrogenase [Oceanococcus atlanticus]RZO85625.1 MAG: SDR family NAD(P)-dependent oxidoreductase [Oceanococcus sp.]